MAVKKRNNNIKLKLADINSTVGSLDKALKIIRDGLPRNIIFQDDPYKIAFHSLGLFSFTRGKYNISNEESVRRQCCFILHKFGIYENDKIDNIFKVTNTEKDYDPIFHFVKHIVGFHRLPNKVLAQLEEKVKSNLRELLALITNYEQDLIIINYKQGINRLEHKSKLLIDFYERCLVERDIIVKYLVNNLENRAIIRASQNDQSKSFGLMWYEDYWDRPYKWWQSRSIEFFDYKKINVCRHRLGEVRAKDIPDLERLYHSNKVLFYKKLKDFLSPKQIFHQLRNYYIPVLPKQIERKPVFEELEKLLNAKRWYGFTALALTQVEGVFSDMLDILYPQKSYSSLSKKVFAVRPHYNFEERNFDYFEYHLPFLRNSFLHSGSIKGKDFKLLSYDLLYDLHYLLRVFLELNDPFIELHKFLKKNSTDTLTDLKSYNHIFSLIKQVEDRSKKHPSNKELSNGLKEWANFEKNILIPSTEVEYIAAITMDDFDMKMTHFFNQIKLLASYNGKEFDLEKENVQYIRNNISMISGMFTEASLIYHEDYNNLMDVVQFAQGYKYYLPNCPQTVIDVFNDIQKRHKTNIAKLKALAEIFKIKD